MVLNGGMIDELEKM